jgi:competence ComEA-like helix-hairpin-helix protein
MREPWKWGFTPGERKALLLICAAVVLGTGYNAWQQRCAPPVTLLARADSLALAVIAASPQTDNLDVSQSSEPAQISGLVNVNLATSRQLEALPGIGPTLARRIIAARDSLRGFRNADDLLKVPGIGPKRLELIRPLLTFTPLESR